MNALRRRLIVRAGLAGCGIAAPAWLRAQGGAARPKRVVAVNAGMDLPVAQHRARDDLWRGLGWEPGRTLVIERLVADGRIERLPELVDAALKLEPDVIVGINEAAHFVARRTTAVPMVFAFAFMPREAGLVDDFAHPDRNATGLAVVAGLETSMKRLDLLRAMAPGARRLSLMSLHPTLFTVSGAPLPIEREWAEAARAKGFEPSFHWLRRSDGIDEALRALAAARPQAVMCSSSVLMPGRDKLAAFVRERRLPAATMNPELLDAGLHLYYGASKAEARQMTLRLVQMTDRILRGARPADIPVEFPTRYALMVNRKAARDAGLALPRELLLQAEEVIE